MYLSARATANATTRANTCWAPAQSSSVSTQCQLVSMYQHSIKLAVSSKWQMSPCQVLALCGADLGSDPTLPHSKLTEAEKLLDLSQYYIFLFTMHQSSSSHFCTVSWHWWKSCQTWVWTSQVCLSLLTWSNKHFAVLALMEWKNRRPEKLRPPLRFFTSCGFLLRWWSPGLASSGQNVSFNWNSQQTCCFLF